MNNGNKRFGAGVEKMLGKHTADLETSGCHIEQRVHVEEGEL